jgi:transcriptional regulator with XRE-family HTH domain
MVKELKEEIEREIDIFLGRKVREHREQVGWSITELADRLGVPHHQMPKYESAEARLTASMLFKLAQLFEISLNSFFEEFQTSTQTSAKAKELLR